MARFLLITMFVFSLNACNESVTIDVAKESGVINSLMMEQQTSWNEGDIDGFMKHYWNSDSLRFVGKRGVTLGWSNTLNNYKKNYPDKKAMGMLQFTNSSVDILDPFHAYVIGKWELFRIEDTLSGHYSLLWKKINKNWVIVADHSS